MSYRIAALLLAAVAALALAGCSGSDSGPSAGPLDLDEATRERWRGWATDADTLARTTDRLYGSNGLRIEIARDQIKAAQDLADAIRASDPPDDAILVLADDLEELVHGLEFGLEFAANTGAPVININVSTLNDAIRDTVQHSQDLLQRLDENDAGDGG